ncbi:MAG: DNA repair protein RadA [Armatimonadetes bacterium]|nr:DNA repair protein RadA [Armatimonadota bacterium]MDW8028588.1 DNA repair protein RadA [Armatimonadota bacterium]
MTKRRSKFVCQNCGYESAQWLGRCPQCGEFNTLVEELEVSETSVKLKLKGEVSKPLPATQLGKRTFLRLSTGFKELDRVLGGGMVQGSVAILSGEPGIGKSTLLLQVAGIVAKQNLVTLYVTGEESLEQIGLRIERLGVEDERLFVLAETDVTAIGATMEELRPSLAVVDSIQATYHPSLTSSPGSVSQVRESTAYLLRIAKRLNIALFLIGHVTKEGFLAGPKVLEHIVDAVLYLEGDANYTLRLVRATKNRFGPTGEIGVFQLNEKGLVEVPNPSQWLLSQRREPIAGTVVAAIMEGHRPLLVEIQGLVTANPFGIPRRVVTGVDLGRVLMILAILERHLHCKFNDRDVFVNVAGGLRITEPAADLPVALAILSSRFDVPIPKDLAAFGELGLTGEIRPVPQGESRVREAKRLGFSRCLGPEDSKGRKDWLPIKTIAEAKRFLELQSR